MKMCAKNICSRMDPTSRPPLWWCEMRPGLADRIIVKSVQNSSRSFKMVHFDKCMQWNTLYYTSLSITKQLFIKLYIDFINIIFKYYYYDSKLKSTRSAHYTLRDRRKKNHWQGMSWALPLLYSMLDAIVWHLKYLRRLIYTWSKKGDRRTLLKRNHFAQPANARNFMLGMRGVTSLLANSTAHEHAYRYTDGRICVSSEYI